MLLRLPLVVGFLFVLGASLDGTALAKPLVIDPGEPAPVILTSKAPSAAEQFAAGELARYLQQVTGRRFLVTARLKAGGSAFVIGRTAVEAVKPGSLPPELGEDGFILRSTGKMVMLAGISDRGTLYAVYSLLERLGCRWFAPNYSFYGLAKGEFVPRKSTLLIPDLQVIERPAFKWRKLYIEEGESHTRDTLLQMIDWMAKARMNVLDCPADYQNLGHTRWDNWREVLTPELRKRGLLIEVGGHGYQTYLPQQKYFSQHPTWFGVRHENRTDDPRVVFSTANADAVSQLTNNIESYLAAHPEIDIFDLWPPDSAHWSEAAEDVALGNPTERQAILLNHVAQRLAKDFPHIHLQFIAYSSYIAPPVDHKPADNILMEFCPIDRSFESTLYEGATLQNQQYFHDLEGWKNGVVAASNISVYSYIPKYAWRSLPVTIPHLVVDEVRKYRDMGIGGFATYSEPANWATFELNHYIIARALWNPEMDVTEEVRAYANQRYGSAGPFVFHYLRLLEEVVPHSVRIPGTDLRESKQKEMVDRFAPAQTLLAQARSAIAGDSRTEVLIAKLEHQCRYVQNEMLIELQLLESSAHPSRLNSAMDELLRQRSKILSADSADGVILHDHYLFPKAEPAD